jgi:hypothetical protein
MGMVRWDRTAVVTVDCRTIEMKSGSAVIAAVEELGLLFLSDPKRKSAIQILTGVLPRGSWWSHPAANQLYAILQGVEEHPDLLCAKLLSGKVTFVHRTLWPALLAVVTAREPWQLKALSAGATDWLAQLDEARSSGAEAAQPSRTVIKELEARLLARSESVHTPGGTHRTKLEDWTTWAQRAGCSSPSSLSSMEGKRALETAADRLGPPPPKFPWQE